MLDTNSKKMYNEFHYLFIVYGEMAELVYGTSLEN